jgi:hypothetical protein
MNDKPEPISLTVHRVDATPVEPGARTDARTTMGRVKMLLVLAVCAAPVIASYLTYYVIRPQSSSSYGTLIQPTRSIPALDLQALDGNVVKASQLRQQWLLVTATPARCSGACEQLLLLQRQLREMLGRERDRVDRVWLVLDDEPIPPALLQGVTATAGATVLRARRDQVASWLAPEPGRQLEDHLYVVDPLGEWMMRMPANAEPQKVKRDVERLLRASASWDRAGR